MTEDDMELAERCHTDSCDHIAVLRELMRRQVEAMDAMGTSGLLVVGFRAEAQAPILAPIVGAVWCPCLPPGGWVCERCGQPVESEPCAEHMDPEGVMVYRPGAPCPDREAQA
jgi:hypothetical protein